MRLLASVTMHGRATYCRQRRGGQHIQDDIRRHLADGWDMGVFHPPCDYLTVSGNRWFRDDARAAPDVLTGQARRDAREEALAFVRELMAAPFPHALENPIGVISTRIREPDCVIQPWQFGELELKATCLWLHRLPPLRPTCVVGAGAAAERQTRLPGIIADDVRPRVARVHRMPPGPDRWKERSRTLPGIARAMATQWSRAFGR